MSGRGIGEDSPGGGNVREADKRGEEPVIPNEMAEGSKTHFGVFVFARRILLYASTVIGEIRKNGK